MAGLLSIKVESDIPDIVDAQTNENNMKLVKEQWNLGPAKASERPDANGAYWAHMGRVWGIDEAKARRQLCANCEYFENTPEMMQAMDAIAFNSLDADGGGRGYCHKFDFICHNLRTCQAWERKDYMAEEQ